MTSLLLQVKVELEETNEHCEGLKNDLSSASADIEAKIATLTEKEKELKILHSRLSQVKEQAAVAGQDKIDGPGGGKAVDGERDGEAVPRAPPGGGGGLCMSQSSNTMLNSSPPAALGTRKGDRIKPGPQPKRTYAMVVAGVKSAPSPPHKTSQQQPLLPSSNSCPAPMVSKPYNMYVNL